MTFIVRPKQPAGTLLALAAGLIAVVALAVAVTARADSTPVGHLPAGAGLYDHDRAESTHRGRPSPRGEEVGPLVAARATVRLERRPPDLRS